VVHGVSPNKKANARPTNAVGSSRWLGDSNAFKFFCLPLSVDLFPVVFLRRRPAAAERFQPEHRASPLRLPVEMHAVAGIVPRDAHHSKPGLSDHDAGGAQL